jgi:hypothetical protein
MTEVGRGGLGSRGSVASRFGFWIRSDPFHLIDRLARVPRTGKAQIWDDLV